MIRWPWQREVTPSEAFQPIDESRERGAAAAFDARVEAHRNADAVLAEAAAVVEAHEAQARATARIFLIPTRLTGVYEASLHWKSLGYRLVYSNGKVEVVR